MATTTHKPHLIDEVGALISKGVITVFDTMLDSKVKPVPVTHWHALGVEIVVGSVGFTGDINGVVYTHLTGEMARTLASRMLGLAEYELDNEMINDVVCELSNMIVGSVKSHLCDSGLPCVLTIPSIVRGTNLSIAPLSSSECRVFCFSCGHARVLVELLMQ